jgi:hypothetical protein
VADLARFHRFFEIGDARQRLVVPRVMIREQLRRGVEVCYGLYAVSLSRVVCTSAIVGISVRRLEFDGRAVVRGGAVVVALTVVRVATRAVGIGQPRVEVDCLVLIRYGAIVVALPCVGRATSAIGIGKPWVEFDRLGVVGDRLVKVAP